MPLPESPRWLILKGREAEAASVVSHGHSELLFPELVSNFSRLPPLTISLSNPRQFKMKLPKSTKVLQIRHLPNGKILLPWVRSVTSTGCSLVILLKFSNKLEDATSSSVSTNLENIS